MRLIPASLCIVGLAGLTACAGPLGGGSGSAPLFGTSAGVQLNIPSPIPVAGTSAMTVAPAVSNGVSFAVAAPSACEPQDVTPPPAFTVHRKTRTLAK